MPTIHRTTAPAWPSIERLGEDAVLLRFGDVIAHDVVARVHAAARQFDERRPMWLLDIVPAYTSLMLVVDPAACPGDDAQAHAIAWLQQQNFVLDSAPSAREVEIVQYRPDARSQAFRAWYRGEGEYPSEA